MKPSRWEMTNCDLSTQQNAGLHMSLQLQIKTQTTETVKEVIRELQRAWKQAMEALARPGDADLE